MGTAAATLRGPRVLLLEEPTNRLDPGGRRLRGHVGELPHHGRTVPVFHLAGSELEP
jgi:ABC-type multidrug transport system ATPase subunit